MLDILNTAQIISLADIRIDGGTQPRAALNQDTVRDYAEEIRNGAEFPPVILYFDGADYWLADGFHRYHAHAAAELEEIYADVRQGTQRDAILHSVGANNDHGLRRTNEDKRRAVLRLLEDKEWAQWSDREIARCAKVSQPLVGKIRKELSDNGYQIPSQRTVTRNGTTYIQDTAPIAAANAERSKRPEGNIWQIRSYGGGFVAFDDEKQLATDPWNTPNAAGIAASEGKTSRKNYIAIRPKAATDNDTPRPATIPDIIAMINYVNETADVLTVDLEWLVDYLQSLTQRKNLTTKPGDLHAIIKQWRRDTLDRQEEEIRQRRLQSAAATPAPQPEPTNPKPSTMSVHFSSETPEHYTPQIVVDAVLKCLGDIDLDPCSNNHESPNIPAGAHYTQDDNGLDQRWAGNVYMNPPYGREIGAWVQKLVTAHETGNVPAAIALVPARTDTQWWATLRNYPVCFVSGRLKFGNADNGAPFPSAIFYLGADIERFYHAFNGLGDIWQRIEPGMFGE